MVFWQAVLHVREVPTVRGPPPLLCPAKSSFSNVGSGHVDNDIDSPTSTPSQHISDTSTPEVFKFIYAQQCVQVWHPV